jgi:hypothetical protein
VADQVLLAVMSKGYSAVPCLDGYFILPILIYLVPIMIGDVYDIIFLSFFSFIDMDHPPPE